MLTGLAADGVEHAPSHRRDRFVPRHDAPARLVHEPERAAHGDLPVGNSLQIATEFRLAQLRVALEQRRRLQLLVDQAGRLERSGQRAVHDARDARRAQRLSERRGLGAAERAELEPVQVAVQDVTWILDVRMADQEELQVR
jgi:hypothetical protein